MWELQLLEKGWTKKEMATDAVKIHQEVAATNRLPKPMSSYLSTWATVTVKSLETRPLLDREGDSQ